jgi:hypothetical protein
MLHVGAGGAVPKGLAASANVRRQGSDIGGGGGGGGRAVNNFCCDFFSNSLNDSKHHPPKLRGDERLSPLKSALLDCESNERLLYIPAS